MSKLPNAFPYQPLSEPSHGGFETRLIYLHPGAFDDCIRCTIFHSDILEMRTRTEYTALSYVWGDATWTHTIQLGYHQPLKGTADRRLYFPAVGPKGFKSFQVTTNLEEALRHLRDSDSKRILWIDAICINQSNRKEVFSQVENMATVYNNALEVRIWLGAASDVCVLTPDIQAKLEDYRLTLNSVEQESSHSCSYQEEDQTAVLSSERIIIGQALLAARDYVADEDHIIGPESSEHRFLNELQSLGIHCIVMQPWWRRVWVIQEATFSKEDPVMQCGYVQIRYRQFLELAKRCIFQHAPSTLSQTHISLIVHGMSLNGYDPRTTSLASRLLAYLSSMSGNFEVSRPKDRINGLYGFLRMGNCHDNILFFMTRNQDEQQEAEFFHQVAIWILFDPEPGSYPLQISESGPSNIEGVPSWVPMWESKRWSGEYKNHGSPESKYEILAKGTSMSGIYHQASIDICARCRTKYVKKWGAPKSYFDIDVRCTELRIRNALALGRVITTVKVIPIQRRKDIDLLRKAILEVEENILAALRFKAIPYADAKTYVRRFRAYLCLNFWNIDTTRDMSLSEYSATLNEFLHRDMKASAKKRQRAGRKVSACQAEPRSPSLSSITKLRSFFEHVSNLVVGSEIVGHIFEGSEPFCQCGDRLYLILECRWVLGLQRSGRGYRYKYRVFTSDLDWQQRKQLFDGKGIYEDIVLV